MGNRTLKLDGGARTTFTYDAANQITTSIDSGGVTTYTYDNAGNLEVIRTPSNQRTTNTWDDENRRTKVHLHSGTINTSTYDGSGLRVKLQESAGSIKKFIWDGISYLLETDNSDVTQVVYTNEPTEFGALLSQRQTTGPTVGYHHFDGLGSTDRITGAGPTASQLASYMYKAYGEIVTSSGSFTNPFRWVGQHGYYFDTAPTEHYVRARAYSPTLTRWLSRDPLLAAESAVLLAGSPPFVNCNNSPLSCIDPTGLFFYTPAIDIAYCKAKLARISQIWTRTHPCAGELLAQFLSPPRVTDPCPESCKAVLTGHGLGFVSDCIKAHLAGLMPGCGQKGDLTFNVAGSHTFQGAPWLQGAAGTNQELHWALNYAVWSADVDCSYLCAQGIVTSAQCCCDCNVSCGWTVKVEDRYDFCTTASNVWREPTWCACLLEKQNVGKPFDVRCNIDVYAVNYPRIRRQGLTCTQGPGHPGPMPLSCPSTTSKPG